VDVKTEKVLLYIQNIPGALDQVVGHIRHEGWNIKRLTADESETAGISNMEIDIEGTHSKLARVAGRLLELDCVQSVTMPVNGEMVTRKKEGQLFQPGAAEETLPQVDEKEEGVFRILTINPGATSTKFALYDNEKAKLEFVIRHRKEELDACSTILLQKEIRKNCITDMLHKAGVNRKSIDAVSGRGGLLKPIESGTYRINSAMLEDLQSATAALHASALGAVIAREIADEISAPAFVVDPVVVDEMDRNAKLTGMPGIERTSIFHALNQKAIARRLAEKIGKPYENARFIVAHLGGGITVGAHRYGRVIDVNDALSGEGAFTPERTGNVPAVPLIEMCFSGEYTKQEMLDKIIRVGGMQGYLGTNDMKKVQQMIRAGDEFAALVLDSMAYQVSKEIGAMTAVLEGRVDAIALTGGLAYSGRFTGAIKERVDKLASVHVFPGEDEMLALMQGALRVLRGEENAMIYE